VVLLHKQSNKPYVYHPYFKFPPSIGIKVMSIDLPDKITTEEQLDDVMSLGSENLVRMMKKIAGDIIILGCAGKIGVQLAMAAVKAIAKAGGSNKVIGVSRFSDENARKKMESFGIETIKCDLLDRERVAKLPNAPNVIFMAGKKFGTSGSADLTWALNTVVPANVAHHFTDSRIVAFSTGNVYDLAQICGAMPTEADLTHPKGEYAQSALGRERVFEYYSNLNKTPVCIIRLNYAIDLRYGVLRDIGTRVFAGQSIDLSTGHVNVIWQGDVINQSLLCLSHCGCPPNIINMTGPETASVRTIAKQFARIFEQEVTFINQENPTALLSDASKAAKLFGYPSVPLLRMIEWVAEWILLDGPSLDKPTHFEVRDGKF
jgi:nucleoside-diphosphate-sugar epimerase